MGSALSVYEVIYAAEGRHLPIQPRGDPSRCMPAHIALWGMLIGISRPGLWLQHSCDTPLCCNPCPSQPGRATEKYADQVERARPPVPTAAPVAQLPLSPLSASVRRRDSNARGGFGGTSPRSVPL